MQTGVFSNDETSVALVSPKFSNSYIYFIINVKIEKKKLKLNGIFFIIF